MSLLGYVGTKVLLTSKAADDTLCLSSNELTGETWESLLTLR